MTIQSEPHTIFFCAGGRCKVGSCLHCQALFKTFSPFQRLEYGRCMHCGQLQDLCMCDDYKYMSRRNNS